LLLLGGVTQAPPFAVEVGRSAHLPHRAGDRVCDLLNAAEMAHLRSSTIDLFEGFTPEMLIRKGTANTNELSVVVLGFIVAGHETHHCNVLRERYLKKK